MNAIQLNYINLKAQYDQLTASEQWDQLEAMEDAFLDAEEALVNWSIDECVKVGMTEEDASILRKNWTKDTERVVNLALSLKVA